MDGVYRGWNRKAVDKGLKEPSSHLLKFKGTVYGTHSPSAVWLRCELPLRKVLTVPIEYLT